MCIRDSPRPAWSRTPPGTCCGSCPPPAAGIGVAATGDPDPPECGPPRSVDDPPPVVQRRGGFISRVKRFDNGCGFLRVDGFDDITFAADYVPVSYTHLRAH